MIKPELFEYAPLARCSRDARLLFIGLLNLADDDGNVSLDAAFIRSRLFPYDDDVTLAHIDPWTAELAESPLMDPYTVDGERYASIRGFDEHQHVCYQHINNPSKWRNPTPHEPLTEDYGSPTGGLLPEDKAKDKDEDEVEVKNKISQPKRDGKSNQKQKHRPPSAAAKNTKQLSPLVTRLVNACLDENCDTEAAAVVDWALAHLDTRLVDQAIGYVAQLKDPPRRPRYLIKVLEAWAEQRGVAIPASFDGQLS